MANHWTLRVLKSRLPYLSVFLTTLSAGLIIFFFLSHVRFLRFVFSDFLAVICIYGFVKSIRPRASPFKTGFGVLLFAGTVEFAQYLQLTQVFDTNHALTQLTVGSTFDWMDIVAYVIGVATAAGIDRWHLVRSPSALPQGANHIGN